MMSKKTIIADGTGCSFFAMSANSVAFLRTMSIDDRGGGLQYGTLVDRPIVVADNRGSADRHQGCSSPEVSKETNHAGTSYVPDMVIRDRKYRMPTIDTHGTGRVYIPIWIFFVPILIFSG